MNKDFVHLHVHTEYSLLDGACRIDNLMQHLKSIGQTACAITDHGVMYGCVDFYKAAKKAGIKPIIGCEVYVAPRTRFDKQHKIDSSYYHLVLLCKNETGYKNLSKLVSAGFIDGFYSKPRVDHELLQQYSEGLVCLSACLAGEVPQALLENNIEKAKEAAQFYLDTFGRENYFIEIQDHGLEDQQTVLPRLISLARDMDIQLVATNDAHYIKKEDSKTQGILICIQTNKTINDEDRMEFETDNFYIKSAEEMYDLFALVPDACENTVKIADMCNYDFEFGKTKLPKFEAPAGKTNFEFLKGLVLEGSNRLYGENKNELVEKRINYELEVINNMGFVDYFLIVYDFINYAKTHDIPVGPGRGSGAGSVVAYSLGITGVDPLQYNLLFERFLNPERISMPDFDIDFCYEKRERVLDYVINKYQSDHVAQIVTFGTMAARAAVRDVGRVLAMPYQQVDEIAKLIPQELKITLERALKISAELKKRYDSDDQVKNLIDIASKIEGMVRHASTHAAGVVITPQQVQEYVPLASNDGQIVTQYPMTTIEELGLLKMDFLGLRTLTVLYDTEKLINKFEPAFKVDDIPFDDKAVYEMLSTGEAEGIFQFESGGMRQVLSSLKPESIEDLIAVISLYRPGPMDSIPTYIRNRHNPVYVKYKHPKLEPILNLTYGVIVYQEQVMQICRELAGFSYAQADLVRRAMSKKKADVMEHERKRFLYGDEDGTSSCVGCIKNGIPERVANEIFNDMTSFASYAFNKSHAAAYATIAYKTAYLKCHYAKEFMAALFTSVLDSTSKVIEYSAECARLGIKLLAPHINHSEGGFTVEQDGIRFGLLAVKNVGRNLIANLVNNRRENGNFVNLYDFCMRLYGSEINRRAVESLIKCGSFDELGYNRRQMIEGLDRILKSIESDAKRNLEGQTDLFGDALGGDVAKNSFYIEPVAEYEQFEILTLEKEASGLYLSGHPLDRYSEKIRTITTHPIFSLSADDSLKYDGQRATIVCTIAKIRMLTTKSQERMAFVQVEDLTGGFEVILFPKTYTQYAELVKENGIVVISGRISCKEDEATTLVVDTMAEIDSYDPSSYKKPYNAKYDSSLKSKSSVAAQAASGAQGGKSSVAAQAASGGQSGKSSVTEQTASGAQSGKNGAAEQNGNGLYLKVPSQHSDVFSDVKETLAVFNGRTPVYIYFEDISKKTLAPQSLWVNDSVILDKELKVLLGEANVVRKA